MEGGGGGDGAVVVGRRPKVPRRSRVWSYRSMGTNYEVVKNERLHPSVVNALMWNGLCGREIL